MASQRWKGFLNFRNLQEFDGKLKKRNLKKKIHTKECLEVSKRLWTLKIGMNVEQGVIQQIPTEIFEILIFRPKMSD